MSLGERMANLRKEKGMSLETLAEALEVSVDDLREWEQDKALPAYGDRLKLCGYFHTTMAYLEGREAEGRVRHGRFSKAEIILILDAALFLLCLLLAPLFQWIDSSLYGQYLTDSREYLQHFPLNILLAFACIIFVVQAGKIIYDKAKRSG
ncbi:helix-turn-helix domain-containing protein [Aedoeadaptatus coli]|uniref:helix-turn-helix domain-containing protein n=1 Tax=Aedoeadaptatus coli TaxID=2058292 RepID=UPI000D559F78|nr:helix-turn-helix transcriptional regulator [Peptoniphilus coli]